jgi:hypothetical protein
LMNIHHNTSLKFILEDDSISSTSRPHICFYSSKGARLWLVIRPSICLSHITHFTFTLALHFCLGLIQPSTFIFLTCECAHELDASNMHLTHCPFKGQRITTHDAIQDVMYAFVQKNGHALWRESSGMPLCQEFHYEPISTWREGTNSLSSMWWLLIWHERRWIRMSLVNQ